MVRQMFLHESFTPQEKIEHLSQINILNWNIRNPSIKRAKQQANWIISTSANCIILTEAKYSAGGMFIRDYLESYGFKVFFPQPEGNDYCVIVACRGFACKRIDIGAKFLPHRIMLIKCEMFLGEAYIIGLYVPSRGPMKRRNVDKRRFQNQISKTLRLFMDTTQASNFIIGGDLNIVERNHVPHYPVFGEWEYEFYDSFIESGLIDAFRLLYPNAQEYSWFGRKGNGYRFDHFFVSRELSQHIVECSYIHDVRSLNLSDHSAMYLTIARYP